MLGFDFHRQKPIDKYILDFFCNELMLGIEVDGISHCFGEVSRRDAEKEARMNDLGIVLIRFNDQQVVRNINGVIEAIENYVLNRIDELKHTP